MYICVRRIDFVSFYDFPVGFWKCFFYVFHFIDVNKESFNSTNKTIQLQFFFANIWSTDIRRVWIYQRGNQNLYIEEEQTTQWPKEKVQKDKQRSTKHTHKTKGKISRTPLKNGGAPEAYAVPAPLVAPVVLI